MNDQELFTAYINDIDKLFWATISVSTFTLLFIFKEAKKYPDSVKTILNSVVGIFLILWIAVIINTLQLNHLVESNKSIVRMKLLPCYVSMSTPYSCGFLAGVNLFYKIFAWLIMPLIIIIAASKIKGCLSKAEKIWSTILPLALLSTIGYYNREHMTAVLVTYGFLTILLMAMFFRASKETPPTSPSPTPTP